MQICAHLFLYIHIHTYKTILGSIHRDWYAYFPLHYVLYWLLTICICGRLVFWEANFELRLMCRSFIREGSGTGEEKEEGLGTGRSWSLMDYPKGFSQTPWKFWSWDGPSQLFQNGKRGSALMPPNWPGTECWPEGDGLGSGHVLQLRQSLKSIGG